MSQPQHQPIRPSMPGPEEARAQFRAMLGLRFAVGVAIVLLFSILGGIGYVVVAVRHQQVQNAPVLKSTQQAAADARHVARRIESCTTPGEPCYERGQKQTGQAVANINKVVILAAACAAQQDNPSVADVQACVISRLSHHKH